MPRHSLRRNSRRFALALSFMLIAGAVAVPAFAQGPPKGFSVDVDADLLACHSDDEEVTCDWEFTVTFTNHARNTGLGAARITVPAGVTSDLPDGRLEATDLGLAPGDSVELFFVGSAVCGSPDEDDFTEPGAKQANDFSGEPGNDLTFLPGASSLTVHLDCPFADFENVVACLPSRDCSIEEGSYRATTGSSGGLMGLRIVSDDTSDDGDPVATALRAACEGLLVGDQRLGGAVAHLLPLGMEQGEHITVTSTIPKRHVNTDVNRSLDLFQVCFAPEKGEPDDEIMVSLDGGEDGTGLFGPLILPDCGDDVPAPCVEDRSKVRADVVLTYRIPAEDPWLM